MNFKTEFIKRFWNVKPKIRIYDLDGTIIDSSHRARHDKNGKLDLDHWRENNTKENIFQDDLLPMYWQLVADYKNGDTIILCTARELGKWDMEYIHSMGIYYDYIYSRPIGDTRPDWKLKTDLCRHLFNFRQYKEIEKILYDDNQLNLGAFLDLGAKICNAKEWNGRYA